MEHSYLRYECADSFGLAVSTGSSKAPLSNSILGFFYSREQQDEVTTPAGVQVVLCTVAGSYCVGYNLTTGSAVLKLGHREQLSDSVGTGRALNSNEMTCLDILQDDSSAGAGAGTVRVATGWIDGSVRIFDVLPGDVTNLQQNQGGGGGGGGLAHSLLHDNGRLHEEFVQRDPLLFHGGHNNASPVRTLRFDDNSGGNRLASGGSDGSVVLWDVVSERGLFRLRGHRGAITEIMFVRDGDEGSGSLGGTGSGSGSGGGSDDLKLFRDGLITCSLDSLIKIWDLQGQCCQQTIAAHGGGEIWGATLVPARYEQQRQQQWRLIAGGKDGRVRVWSVHAAKQQDDGEQQKPATNAMATADSLDSAGNAAVQGAMTTSKAAGQKEKNKLNTGTSTRKNGIDDDGKNNEKKKKDGDDNDDVCHFMGTLIPPPNVVTSADRVACIHRDHAGRFVGILHAGSKNVDIYKIRSRSEVLKRRQRRLKRRQEKSKKKEHKKGQQQDQGTCTSTGASGGARGILDDPVDVNVNNGDDGADNDNDDDDHYAMDPERIKASDEFEYLATIRASHKVRGFVFCPPQNNGNNNNKVNSRGGEIVRVVSALTTNALQTHVLRWERGRSQKEEEQQREDKKRIAVVEQVSSLEEHPTGIRAVALSGDDTLACTVSKSVTKIWNVERRSCLQTLHPAVRVAVNNDDDDDMHDDTTTTKKKKKKKGSTKTKNTSKPVSCYGLCASFLPGNHYVLVGTREGHLLLLDIHAGDICAFEINAHEGAIWSVDVKQTGSGRPGGGGGGGNDYNNYAEAAEAAAGANNSVWTVVTGSADKTVKFWDVEEQERVQQQDSNDGSSRQDVAAAATSAAGGGPVLVHTRTLQMTEDVVAARYSYPSADTTRTMVFVSTLDNTIKVFFDDSLKLCLSLYGHKLPALALDASDDGALLASGSADKTVKIWGLDFGDTHRTLHGHEDSVTDVRFVRRTHNFFTASKDGTARYWDGDRFENILVLEGHFAEVNAVAVSRAGAGAFVLTAGMDRQVRVWERTKDMVFLQEERERELERALDRVRQDDQEGGTAAILRRRHGRGGGQQNDDDDDELDPEDDADREPQSEAAVKRSIMSVSSGDRILEALERADQERKDIALFRKSQGVRQRLEDKVRSPNPLLFGLEPAPYVLWVLRSIKSAELEQSLLLLPLSHLERLVYYLVILLKTGRGVELVSRVAVFMIKTHQNQIVANQSLATPLRELRRLVRLRLAELRDVVGYDLAALTMIARVAKQRKQQRGFLDAEEQQQAQQAKQVWAGLGLGSDAAAELEGRSNNKQKKNKKQRT